MWEENVILKILYYDNSNIVWNNKIVSLLFVTVICQTFGKNWGIIKAWIELLKNLKLCRYRKMRSVTGNGRKLEIKKLRNSGKTAEYHRKL